MVFQDVLLFDDTVMGNIRLGRRDATDAEVLAAARAANCDEFVAKLPCGYDTMIGENGSKLSGGERQRISIARALLKDAPIVLLDEATASLDVENESQVQQALSNLLAGKTVIVIAHRMRTVMNADKIVVLDEGRIVEEGSPSELLDDNGLFSRMVSPTKPIVKLCPLATRKSSWRGQADAHPAALSSGCAFILECATKSESYRLCRVSSLFRYTNQRDERSTNARQAM